MHSSLRGSACCTLRVDAHNIIRGFVCSFLREAMHSTPSGAASTYLTRVLLNSSAPLEEICISFSPLISAVGRPHMLIVIRMHQLIRIICPQGSEEVPHIITAAV